MKGRSKRRRRRRRSRSRSRREDSRGLLVTLISFPFLLRTANNNKLINEIVKSLLGSPLYGVRTSLMVSVGWPRSGGCGERERERESYYH